MAYATLLIQTLLCIGAMVLIVLLRRDAVRLRDFGPRGPRGDLTAFRRTFGGLGWKLALLVPILICVVILGAQWAPGWRLSMPGQAVLTSLCFLAGLNVVIAFAKGHHQQWSANGSMLGLLRAGLMSAVAVGLFMLTLFWGFGT